MKEYTTIKEDINVKLVEEKIVIAERQPPGDRWKLIDDDKNIIYNSIIDTLEAYYNLTNNRCDFILSPLKSKIYALNITEEVIKPEPIKHFNIYGDPVV